MMKKPISPRQKGPRTYDRNCWWMVYVKINKGLPPLRITNLSKKDKTMKKKSKTFI